MDQKVRMRVLPTQSNIRDKVQLPTIAYPTVSISGAGMMGNMNVPLIGMVDAMSATINFLTVTQAAASLAAPRQHLLDLRVAEGFWGACRGGCSLCLAQRPAHIRHVINVPDDAPHVAFVDLPQPLSLAVCGIVIDLKLLKTASARFVPKVRHPGRSGTFTSNIPSSIGVKIAEDIDKALKKAGWIISHGGSHDLATHPQKPGIKIAIPRHKEVPEFTVDWTILTGQDSLAIEAELAKKQKTLVNALWSEDYLAGMAVRACTWRG